jgi:hypothetical protein
MRKHVGFQSLGLSLALVFLLALAPTASQAEVRTLTIADPADATPTISGIPNNPDIRQVSISYDASGSLTLTASFYNAFDTLDASSNYAFWAKFNLSASKAEGAGHLIRRFDRAPCWRQHSS